MQILLKRNNGLTLIELMVALVISSILIAAIYQTFVRQQNTYVTQEQVVDLQQNVRVAINQMMREIRTAGFGNLSTLVNEDIITHVITPEEHAVTFWGGGLMPILTADGGEIGISNQAVEAEKTKITLDHELPADLKTDNKIVGKLISVGGLETFRVDGLDGKTLTLHKKVTYYSIGKRIFLIGAVTYGLNGSELKRNGVAMAENIEDITFKYYDRNYDETDDPDSIQMIKVTVTATTAIKDPEYKGDGGIRRRQIASNIMLRNMGLAQ